MLDNLYTRIRAHYRSDELVFSAGSMKSGLLLIGEAPGREEVKEKRPFAGTAGRNLDEFLSVLGLSREEICITNVCKFRPHKISAKGTVSNRPPTRKEILAATPFLQEEISLFAPSLIVTLGNTPLRAVLSNYSANIGDFHGDSLHTSILGQSYSLFPLYHPASIIYNPGLKQVYHNDLTTLARLLKK